MEAAALVLEGPGGEVDERVAGHVVSGHGLSGHVASDRVPPGYVRAEDGSSGKVAPLLLWRPSAQCQFERDALERLFAHLAPPYDVRLELADRTLRCRVTAVDHAALLLELTVY